MTPNEEHCGGWYLLEGMMKDAKAMEGDNPAARRSFAYRVLDAVDGPILVGFHVLWNQQDEPETTYTVGSRPFSEVVDFLDAVEEILMALDLA